MGLDLKFSAGVWVFGAPKDRFCRVGYRGDVPLEARFELMSKVDGLKGVELHYPSEVSERNIDKVKDLCKAYKLQVVFTVPDIFSEPKWQMGALCSLNEDIRRDAVQRGKVAVEFARELKAYMIVIWPGQDGYDYPFQINYLKAFDKTVESLREIAQHDPKVKVALEYKPLDPRSHIILGTAGKTLTLIHELGLENIGINIEIAHAQIALENLAETICLMARYKKLFHTHFNDSFKIFDNDLIVGAVNFWETLEALYWLQEVKYEGWYGLDLFPAREDPVKAVQESINNIRFMVGLLDKVDREELKRRLEEGDAAKIQPILRAMLS